MAVRTAYAGAAVSGEVLTAANVNKVPGGWIGYAEVTAAQTGITTATDLTGLTLTVTVGASRRIRVSANVLFRQMTTGAVAEVNIYEGATRLQRFLRTENAGSFAVATPSVVVTPTAGAHTYNLKGLTAAGTFEVQPAADYPAYILVEDLGPAT